MRLAAYWRCTGHGTLSARERGRAYKWPLAPRVPCPVTPARFEASESKGEVGTGSGTRIDVRGPETFRVYRWHIGFRACTFIVARLLFKRRNYATLDCIVLRVCL